jgi:hypothetical protein
MTESPCSDASADGIPTPLAEDDDDVSWALHTALVQWRRGLFDDALQWLQRAVESALEVGHAQRAEEIQRAIAELTERTQTGTSNTLPPAPSARAIMESIHDTLEEAAAEGLMAQQIDGSAPLTALPTPASGPTPGRGSSGSET